MIDQFFTPQNIASTLTNWTRQKKTKIVADFSIGDGNLIKGIKFKPKTVVGVDIDNKVLKNLAIEHPTWLLRKADFLNLTRSDSTWLQKWKGKVDLVLLNPPFSWRGGGYLELKIDNHKFRCRKALAFVINALPYLKKDGKLIAVLPLSTKKSELDQKLIRQLSNNWDFKFGEVHDRTTFQGCSPNSVILTIRKRKGFKTVLKESNSTKIKPVSKIELVRGRLPMYLSQQSGRYEVIHTTSFEGGILKNGSLRRTESILKLVSGTFLCIPRVGQPNQQKIIVIKTKNKYVLSDCIIALRGENEETTYRIQKLILSKWTKFKRLYDSTCAPYITIKQLEDFFWQHGISCVTRGDFLVANKKSKVNEIRNKQEKSLAA